MPAILVSYISEKKCYMPHKPDSVSTPSFICLLHCCKSVAAYPVASDEQPSIATICGISAPEVYPKHALLHTSVRFYRTFSPFLYSISYRVVIFCGTFCICNHKPRPLAGRLFFAVRTFLSVFGIIHSDRAGI